MHRAPGPPSCVARPSLFLCDMHVPHTAFDESAKKALVSLARPLVLGVAIVVAAAGLAKTLVEVVRIRHKEQRITVTGSASRRIRSDFIVWEAHVRTQD